MLLKADISLLVLIATPPVPFEAPLTLKLTDLLLFILLLSDLLPLELVDLVPVPEDLVPAPDAELEPCPEDETAGVPMELAAGVLL